MASGWQASLKSDYRGLCHSKDAIQFRDLTVLLGPNNGGKSQYLRSCLLVDAVRQVLTQANFGVSFFTRGLPPKKRSIVQALIDAGFRDLAEEMAELMKAGGKLSLAWEASIPDFSELKTIVVSRVGQLFGIVQTPKPVKSSKTRARFDIELSFDQGNRDVVLSNCSISGLWENLSINLKAGKSPQTVLPGHAPAFFDVNTYDIVFHLASQDLSLEGFSKYLVEKATGSEKSPLKGYPKELLLQVAAGTVLQETFNLLPEIVYIGPIRIQDDRDYSQDSRRLDRSVGREGEFTWNMLQELEKSRVASAWLEKKAREILRIGQIRSDRDSPTQPKVTARIGDLELPLHSYGLGTSQVMPLLVQMAILQATDLPTNAGPQPLVIMEEPESHLHPAAQKALAKAMCEFVAAGGRLLVETHSEIILRSVELEIASRTIQAGNCILNWVDFRGPHRKDDLFLVLEFSEKGSLSGDLPPTFDQVVTELVERRLLKG